MIRDDRPVFWRRDALGDQGFDPSYGWHGSELCANPQHQNVLTEGDPAKLELRW